MWIICVLFRLRDKVKRYYNKFFNKHIKVFLKSSGEGVSISPSFVYMGLNNVSIGNNFRAGERLKIRAFNG